MKKKFKLFASLASLCLSLGILCFGVYAATSVNYTATGSVSYTVSDVFVNVSSKLYRSTTNAVSTTTQVDEVVTALKADPSTATGVEETGYTGDTVETLVDGSVVSPGQEVTGEAKDIAINYGSYTAEGDTAYAYYLVVEIENLGNETIKAEVTNNIADASALNSYIPAVKNTNIAADQTVRLVIAFALVDPTVGITENGDFEFDIVISQGSLPTIVKYSPSWEDTSTGNYMYYNDYFHYYGWAIVSIDGGQTSFYASNYTGNKEDIDSYLAGKELICVSSLPYANQDGVKFISADKYRQATAQDVSADATGKLVEGNYYIVDTESTAETKPFITDESGNYVLANNYLYSDIRQIALAYENSCSDEFLKYIVPYTKDGLFLNIFHFEG